MGRGFLVEDGPHQPMFGNGNDGVHTIVRMLILSR